MLCSVCMLSIRDMTQVCYVRMCVVHECALCVHEGYICMCVMYERMYVI